MIRAAGGRFELRLGNFDLFDWQWPPKLKRRQRLPGSFVVIEIFARALGKILRTFADSGDFERPRNILVASPERLLKFSFHARYA
jgi:hypothetical protein